MTVPAQAGVVGFAHQNAKIGNAGSFAHLDHSFYKVLAPRINFGVMEDVQQMPLELGGKMRPTGIYKQQYLFGGDMDILPRLGSFGLLLKAALGKVTTTADTFFGVANVGVNTHKFQQDETNVASQPWMSFRRLTPGALAADNSGETGFDCKVDRIRLTIPGMGKLAARVSFLGRDVVLDDASTWVWQNAAYEDSSLIPESGRGHFKIGGTEYPITGLIIDIANNLSTPRDEAVVGDFRMDDIICLSRGVTIRAVYKYANDDLYRQILTGNVGGTTWTSLPFMTSGAGVALEAYFEAPATIPGAATTAQYALKATASKVSWQVDGPPQLVGGGIVQLNLIGTLVEPDAGDYFAVELANDEDAAYYTYVDPSA